MAYRAHPLRVLIIPGLRGSGPAHWQTWLQARFRDARRVEQDDWERADLPAWSARIAQTLAEEPAGPWVAVAHSFGCLALAHHLLNEPTAPAPDGSPLGVAAALLVAPAEPARFGLQAGELRRRLQVPAAMLASDTDLWMPADTARDWAAAWGSGFVNLGDAGHINAEAGYGPLPPALHLTRFLSHRVEQARRLSRADVQELSFAI